MEEEQTTKAKLKDFSRECLRVLKITKKPTMKEFKVVVTITGIGILLMGFIGFVITIIKQLLF
jgi:protein transport protein SEC61 subunit gamma and related proteins